MKRKAYFIEEQERQCKLLNEVLTRRRILFQLSADSSPHGLKRVTFFDRNSPLIKEITRSMHEHRKAVRRAVKTKERFRAEMKQLFPEVRFTSDCEAASGNFFVILERSTVSQEQSSIRTLSRRFKSNELALLWRKLQPRT